MIVKELKEKLLEFNDSDQILIVKEESKNRGSLDLETYEDDYFIESITKGKDKSYVKIRITR